MINRQRCRSQRKDNRRGLFFNRFKNRSDLYSLFSSTISPFPSLLYTSIREIPYPFIFILPLCIVLCGEYLYICIISLISFFLLDTDGSVNIKLFGSKTTKAIEYVIQYTLIELFPGSSQQQAISKIGPAAVSRIIWSPLFNEIKEIMHFQFAICKFQEPEITEMWQRFAFL